MQLFIDQLTNVDFSYLCPMRGLVGETWIAHLTLTGALDEQGMICDFGVVKRIAKALLDEQLDHTLAVPTQTPSLRLETDNQRYHINLQSAVGTIASRGPLDAVALFPCAAITPATLASHCSNALQAQLPTDAEVRLHFTTEPSGLPYYHYSHGLKKHAGKCQRIAHGHRSNIMIYRNGELAPGLMEQWAATLRDIYIGTREDLVATTGGQARFAYTAAQGPFELELPLKRCHLIDTDSTVELIAAHIHRELTAAEPGVRFRVKAFEGLGKGAMVEG